MALKVINATKSNAEPYKRFVHEIEFLLKLGDYRGVVREIYGVGELTAVTILAELGDPHRFQNSRDFVRYAGLDITVYQSDNHRSPGHLSRQGPPALRWALYEAAQVARHPRSPDCQYYLQLAERIGGNGACIAIARNYSNAATTSSTRSATRPSRPSPPDHS